MNTICRCCPWKQFWKKITALGQMKGAVYYDMTDTVIIQYAKMANIQEKTVLSTFIQNNGNTLNLRIHEMRDGNTGICLLSFYSNGKQKGAQKTSCYAPFIIKTSSVQLLLNRLQFRLSHAPFQKLISAKHNRTVKKGSCHGITGKNTLYIFGVITTGQPDPEICDKKK